MRWGFVLGGLGALGALFFARRALGGEASVDAGDSVFQTGVASWYGPGLEGNLTANGEAFDSSGLTAAHRTLPFGTQVRVTRVDTGDSVDVRINDRGPYISGRIIDLAEGAADVIGLRSKGTAQVELRLL